MPTPLHTGVVFKKQDILGKHIQMEQLKMNKEQHALNMEASQQARKDKRAGKIDHSVDTSGYSMSREFRPMFRKEVEKATQEIGGLYSAYMNGDNEAAQKIEDIKKNIQYMGEDLTSLSTDISSTDSKFSENKDLYTRADDGSINYENNRNSIYSAFGSGEVTMGNYQNYLNKYDVSVAGNTEKLEPYSVFDSLSPKDGWTTSLTEGNDTYSILSESAVKEFKQSTLNNLSPTTFKDKSGNKRLKFVNSQWEQEYFNGTVLINESKENAMDSFIMESQNVEDSEVHRAKLTPNDPNYDAAFADEYTQWRADKKEEEQRSVHLKTLTERKIDKPTDKGEDNAWTKESVDSILSNTETFEEDGLILMSEGNTTIKGVGNVHIDVNLLSKNETHNAKSREAILSNLSSGEATEEEKQRLLREGMDAEIVSTAYDKEYNVMAKLQLKNGDTFWIPAESIDENTFKQHTTVKKMLSLKDNITPSTGESTPLNEGSLNDI